MTGMKRLLDRSRIKAPQLLHLRFTGQVPTTQIKVGRCVQLLNSPQLLAVALICESAQVPIPEIVVLLVKDNFFASSIDLNRQ